MIELLDKLDNLFSVINTSITDIDQDKDELYQLVLSKNNADNQASIVTILFRDPVNMIDEIIDSQKRSLKYKKDILTLLSAIEKTYILKQR